MKRNFFVLKGTIQGKTIKLDEQPGLPDGQEVVVGVLTGDGTGNSAGAWADMTTEEEEELEKTLSHLRGRPVNVPKIERQS